MNLTMEKLKRKYESVVDAYVKKFCIKHDLDADYVEWVGGKGGVMEVCDYWFGFDDIRFDLEHDLPVGMIFEWHDASVDHSFCREHRNINLRSWFMGARYEKPYGRFKLLKWRLKPIYDAIKWHLWGRVVMKRRLSVMFNTMYDGSELSKGKV
jgi:hypothetical protein